MKDRDYAYIISLTVGAVLAVSLIFYITVGKHFIRIPACAIYQYTGIYCPACGGTRALLALAKGRVLSALYYHPLVPYSLLVYVCYLAEETRERLFPGRRRVPLRFWKGCVYAGLAFLLGNVLLRNILKFGFGIFLKA